MKPHFTSLLFALIAASLHGQGITGITKTPIANAPKDIAGTTAGPDGNVWFVDFKDNAIGRLTPAGDIKLFPLPTGNSNPDQITAGLDGNLWFTEMAGRIGRITTSGVVTEFSVANSLDGQRTIVSGVDGALWFFDVQSAFPPAPAANWKIGRITTSGALTTYDLGSSDTFVTMATGPDGNLWLYDSTNNTVAKFDTGMKKVVATYAIPQPAGQFQGYINHFAIGPDGNLWFTHDNSIVRIKMDGTMTEYPIPTANGIPSALVLGGDGNLWFTEYSSNKIGQLIVSTATDSGQATFHESDPILDAGALDMVPLGGKTPAITAPAYKRVEDQLNPCTEWKFTISCTIAGTWVEYTWTVPPQKQCADLDVTTEILNGTVGGFRSFAPILGGAQARIECKVLNVGPSIAENVDLACQVSGVLINPTVRGDPSCTFTPTGISSYKITATLAAHTYCILEANYSPVPGANVLRGDAFSDTFDPDESNNIDISRWDPIQGRIEVPPSRPVTTPVERGPNH